MAKKMKAIVLTKSQIEDLKRKRPEELQLNETVLLLRLDVRKLTKRVDILEKMCYKSNF